MLIWLIIIVGAVFLDQISKWLTVINLDLYETFPVIKDIFHFTYVRNTGAAFGILKDHRWVFLLISTVAIIALSVFLWKKRNDSKLLCTAMSFIIGGGIGNMIDRLSLGYVVDFLDFRIINYPIFNIADSFVCVGVGMFAFYIILEEIREYKSSRALKEAVSATADEAVGETADETQDSTENDAENDSEADN